MPPLKYISIQACTCSVVIGRQKANFDGEIFVLEVKFITSLSILEAPPIIPQK